MWIGASLVRTEEGFKKTYRSWFWMLWFWSWFFGSECSSLCRWSHCWDASGGRGIQQNPGSTGPGRNRTDQSISTGCPITRLRFSSSCLIISVTNNRQFSQSFSCLWSQIRLIGCFNWWHHQNPEWGTESNDCKQSFVMSSMVSVSRCSWTWWRTTQPVCGSWSWQRMTSVQSYSSRSVTCCLKERMMKTERLCPSSQAPPPVTSCCLSETSIIQSETSTSPPPGSPTVVRAEYPPPLLHLSHQLVPSVLWLPKTRPQH